MQEMERISEEQYRVVPGMDVTIVLDNIRSMMNTGSVFRTADAFRSKQIFLCGFTATPPHREIHKTALGATESVKWEYRSDCAALLKELRTQGALVVAVEQVHGSISLDHWTPDPGQPLVLVFGNEVEGIQQEVLQECEYALEIPQYGTKHSLNIAVSAGIVLWETYKKFRHQIQS